MTIYQVYQKYLVSLCYMVKDDSGDLSRWYPGGDLFPLPGTVTCKGGLSKIDESKNK